MTINIGHGIRGWLVLFSAICALTTAARGDSPPDDVTASLRPRIDSAIARMKPALVRIHVVSAEYGEGREMKMQAVGSGAIITADGYLITNHHVAGHSRRIFCTLWDREDVEAELVGTDPLTDIAILKLKPEKPRGFQPADFGDSSGLHVGDYVLAMGSPMALSQSVTLGILSNVEMIMPKFFGPLGSFKMDGEEVGTLVRWLGHDAAIYPGNSGGPLVNLEGQIIGVNEISLGLGGAIPGNLARSVADQLIAHGKITRSWLGLDVQPRFKHSPAERGVLIGGVVRGSPAAEAGIKAGDLLLQLGDTVTNARFDEEMPDFMRVSTGLEIGKPITARVWREGKEIACGLTPVERGELRPAQQEIKPWGITVRDLSFLLAKELKRPSQDGVLVTSVRPGGPAGEAKPPLSADDVLVEVNGVPIKKVEDLLTLTKSVAKGERTPVVAAFERKSGRYLTVINIGVQELRDPGREVTKAWLPIESQVISREIAKQLGEPNLKGSYITQVYPGSTAAKAGLKAGDFVVAVDGEKLTSASPEHEDELVTMMRQFEVGKTVELSVLRNKIPLKIPVELARSPKLKREMKKFRSDRFEFTARDVSFFDVADEQWDPTQRGALVEEVKSGSWAELGALLVGDLIVELDGQAVTDVDTLKRVTEQIAARKAVNVKLKVQRGIHTVYLELEPSWKD